MHSQQWPANGVVPAKCLQNAPVWAPWTVRYGLPSSARCSIDCLGHSPHSYPIWDGTLTVHCRSNVVSKVPNTCGNAQVLSALASSPCPLGPLPLHRGLAGYLPGCVGSCQFPLAVTLYRFLKGRGPFLGPHFRSFLMNQSGRWFVPVGSPKAAYFRRYLVGIGPSGGPTISGKHVLEGPKKAS